MSEGLVTIVDPWQHAYIDADVGRSAGMLTDRFQGVDA